MTEPLGSYNIYAHGDGGLGDEYHAVKFCKVSIPKIAEINLETKLHHLRHMEWMIFYITIVYQPCKPELEVKA